MCFRVRIKCNYNFLQITIGLEGEMYQDRKPQLHEIGMFYIGYENQVPRRTRFK